MAELSQRPKTATTTPSTRAPSGGRRPAPRRRRRQCRQLPRPPTAPSAYAIDSQLHRRCRRCGAAAAEHSRDADITDHAGSSRRRRAMPPPRSTPMTDMPGRRRAARTARGAVHSAGGGSAADRACRGSRISRRSPSARSRRVASRRAPAQDEDRGPLSLLRRLANVGLGRREEDPLGAGPQRSASAAANGQPRRRSNRRSRASQRRRRGGSRSGDYAKRPPAPRAASQRGHVSAAPGRSRPPRPAAARERRGRATTNWKSRPSCAVRRTEARRQSSVGTPTRHSNCNAGQ